MVIGASLYTHGPLLSDLRHRILIGRYLAQPALSIDAGYMLIAEHSVSIHIYGPAIDEWAELSTPVMKSQRSTTIWLLQSGFNAVLFYNKGHGLDLIKYKK